MTSITERNAKALTQRNGTTLPEVKAAPRKAVAKGNKAVAQGKDQATKAVAPSNSPAPVPVKCRCGCGADANIGRSYRPGHDAKHAGMVARAIIDGASRDLLATLAPKLQEKANRMIANAADRQAKKAAAAKIRQAAAEALKAELAAL